VSDTDKALKPILTTLLRLLEVSEQHARHEQSNHTAQLRAIESALSKQQNVDLPKALSTFSSVITSVADHTTALIQVNNELVQSHREQKEIIDKLISSFELYASRMDVLAMIAKNQSNDPGLGAVFGQIETANQVD